MDSPTTVITTVASSSSHALTCGIVTIVGGCTIPLHALLYANQFYDGVIRRVRRQGRRIRHRPPTLPLWREERMRFLTVIVSLSLLVSAFAVTQVIAAPIGSPAFEQTWARTDKPVREGVVQRTWMWGPEAFTPLLYENYAQSPNGQRVVQYFDKSRMEITHPDAFDDGVWYVTNGLLVVEMVEGYIQTGDIERDESPDAADVNIAGDPGEHPTYADINHVDLTHQPATPEGTVITAVFDDDNMIRDDPTYADAGVTAAHRVTIRDAFGNVTLDQTVASPFWAFMNAQGTVWNGSNFVEDQLFVNPFYATGYPITEAYWSEIAVDGQNRDVLWQCFERRCLTYTPTNEPTWQVEAGNVGCHYYEWRYGEDEPTLAPTSTPTPTPAPTVTPTPSPTPSPTPTPTTPVADRDCTDFASQADAQGYFDANGGSAANNVDGLDSDRDGWACESLPAPYTLGFSPPSEPPPPHPRAIAIRRTPPSASRRRRPISTVTTSRVADSPSSLLIPTASTGTTTASAASRRT